MKIRRLFGIALLAVIAFSTSALERQTVAPSAQDVTPLLDGMAAPATVLRAPSGAPVSLKALLMDKPTLVLFYRGGWCPYCSRQLASLKTIEAPLSEMGYQILAISPETPEKLKSQMTETEFAAKLYSDSALDTLKGFGVAFYLDAETTERYRGLGIQLTEDESGRPVLPAPALFFVNTDGIIEMSYVNPDYKVRPSAELVLAVAKALSKNN